MARAGLLLDIAAMFVITMLMFYVIPRVIGLPLFK
jgi:hypothetical protein